MLANVAYIVQDTDVMIMLAGFVLVHR